MKKLCALLLLCHIPAFAATFENIQLANDRVFANIPPLPPLKFERPSAFRWIQNPKPIPAAPFQTRGAAVGKVHLAGQLDRHRDLVNLMLGVSAWNLSVAGDQGFKNLFITFQRGAKLIIAPLGDPKRLRSQEGVDIAVEPGLIYNFRVSINIFNPVRGSTLEITPAKGTRGPSHKIKLGALLDAAKTKSYVFNSGSTEYWMLYGTDVDAATRRLSATRSFLFLHENGMNTKAWQMSESALPVGQPTAVSFENENLVLTRTAEGELLIQSSKLYSF